MYIGRFAPSPTGLLHIGSLLTALASYADARAAGGRWLVRMEDLDPPREMPGAAAHILRTLEAFGFEWDGEVAYQSRRHPLYRAALQSLQQSGLAYPCYCSRKQWHAQARQGVDGFVYNGACAPLAAPPPEAAGRMPAWRLRVPDEIIAFYQLAVVADDAEQGITHIVRGQALLVSTPRQIWLQRCLGLPTPHYAHLPLLTNAEGQKWSKQTLAPALDLHHKEALLRQVMGYLKLPPAPAVDKPQELLGWAVQHWQLQTVPIRPIVAEAAVDKAT